MTEAQTALSRRAGACKGWRWMPGARWIVTRAAPLEDYAGRIVEGGRRAPDGPGLPDLADPATLGCLLALVREAYSEDRTWVRWWAPEGCAYSAHPLDDWKQPDALFTSEAEALVAALESAP